jgi:SAM-dependent methyltransferase
MNLINKLNIDTTNCVSELCQIMASYKTDKSPLVSPLLGRLPNDNRHFISDEYTYPVKEYAHAYTGVYSFLFSSFRNKKIKLGEIGVNYNYSIKGWRDWFPKAEIHGFEWVKEFIIQAQQENLPEVYYHYVNVYEKDSIHAAMNKAGKNFDIIIEDSCHLFETQMNVIETVHEYLNPGGILVVEDIYPIMKNKNNGGYGDYVEEEFAEAIEPFKKYYSDIVFVNAENRYKYTGLYGEVRMLVLTK